MIETMDGDIKRAGWPSGPWDDEPDRVEFKSHGFDCIVLRQVAGHLCGYVGVPAGHPWHGVDFGAGDAPEVSVHGGVTYSEHCAGKVCHVPAPGEPEHLFWVGFDCAHSGDARPRDLMLDGERDWFGCYKSIGYVRGECMSLANQALNAAVPT